MKTAIYIEDGTLISINQAVELGVDRLRKPIWSNKMDHLKIDIINGELGPWVHLYSPGNKEINGRDPADFLRAMQVPVASQDECVFVPYEGPLPDSEEYRAEAAKFEMEINNEA